MHYISVESSILNQNSAFDGMGEIFPVTISKHLIRFHGVSIPDLNSLHTHNFELYWTSKSSLHTASSRFLSNW